MRILALNPSARIGGAELSLLDILEGLAVRGHSILLATPLNGNLPEAAAVRGIQTQSWDMPTALRRAGRYSSQVGLPLAVFSAIRAARSLLGIIRRHRPEIIYSNGVKSHLISGALRLFTRRPVVWHVRDFISNRKIAHILFAMARSARVTIVANSNAVGREWYTEGISATVVHNGFRAISPPQPRTTKRHLQLLTAGILAPWKGFDIVIRACSLLPKELEWRLTICGDEIYETDGHHGERDRLEKLSRELAISDRVLFTGMVEDLGPYFQECDILLHGSVKPEPFGRVVAEAMLAEVPVIASHAGGIPEIVRPHIDGLLYPMGNAQHLRDAICYLGSDSARRQQMGRSARTRILSDFSFDRKIEQIEQLFASVAPAYVI